MERINDPRKNWKFSMADLKERGFWDLYQKSYMEAIGATSTDYAPWFIIPADDKWFARLAIASVIHHHFDQLYLSYPKVTEAQKAELQRAKQELLGEKKNAFHLPAQSLVPPLSFSARGRQARRKVRKRR